MFKASNNEVDYEALIMIIDLCCDATTDSMGAFLDTQLAVNQPNQGHNTKDEVKDMYLQCI